MTIQEWLQDAEQKLVINGVESARLDAMILLEFALDTPRAALLAHYDMELPATTLVRANDLLAQRLDGLPIAYILHKKEFYGRDFIVDEHVLIPRPETEDMIDIIKELQLETPVIADIGTGSGCIAITLALELPNAKVIATDVSDKALHIAKLNAKHLHAQVTCKESDLFEKLQNKKLDVVCANLPYVPEGLVTSREITKEPALALFSGKDGLNHYKKFFAELKNMPHQPRYITTEALQDQHKTVDELATNAGYTLLQTRGLIQLFIKD